MGLVVLTADVARATNAVAFRAGRESIGESATPRRQATSTTSCLGTGFSSLWRFGARRDMHRRRKPRVCEHNGGRSGAARSLALPAAPWLPQRVLYRSFGVSRAATAAGPRIAAWARGERDSATVRGGSKRNRRSRPRPGSHGRRRLGAQEPAAPAPPSDSGMVEAGCRERREKHSPARRHCPRDRSSSAPRVRSLGFIARAGSPDTSTPTP